MNRRHVRETLARKIMGHAATTRLTAITDRGVTMGRTAMRLTQIDRVILTTVTTTATNESVACRKARAGTTPARSFFGLTVACFQTRNPKLKATSD